MQLEVGSILEGKVTGITKFGAFVELPTGKTGMVHISEVSSSYVKEISDHLAENQMVKVKVLNITDDGKVSLSIKKCQENQPGGQLSQDRPPRQGGAPHHQGGGGGAPRGGGYPRKSGPREHTWRGVKQAPSDNLSFEDMMTRFKQTSDDKMSDLKRNTDMRKGSSRKGAR